MELFALTYTMQISRLLTNCGEGVSAIKNDELAPQFKSLICALWYV